MEHFFNLPVIHNGQELSLQARLVTSGYNFRFYIMVDRFELQVERDDQMAFRILNYEEAKID